MNENRKRVLDMLDSHKITAEEAFRLLDAMEDKAGPTAGATTAGRRDIKYLRVMVDDPNGHHGEGPQKVNIRVPVALIRAGMKFKSLIPNEAGDRVEEALKEKGISLNLKNLKDEDIDELIQALTEVEVDVDSNGPHGKVKVKIMAE